MKTENITIANLSCGGCVKTIIKKLTEISGVEKVAVDLETNIVSVNHNEHVSRAIITQKLLAIGYPEATENNGLLTQLKSITSCITGKLSN
jgi:copper chaperone CopZ